MSLNNETSEIYAIKESQNRIMTITCPICSSVFHSGKEAMSQEDEGIVEGTEFSSKEIS